MEEEAVRLARETGFLERERAFTGADFAQALILGWVQRPDERVEGLVQSVGRREVQISAPGLSQRFTQEAARFLYEILQRLTQVQMQAEMVEVALLRRFRAVLVEESSQVVLPAALETIWRGWGKSQHVDAAVVKLFVRWDGLAGQLDGARLTNGRHPETRSPFNEDELPAGGLDLADLGFFSLQRLAHLARRRLDGQRFFVMRWPSGTGLSTRGGHRINLRGIVPQREGEAKACGGLVGAQAQLPVRLLLVRVSDEVAEQRRQPIRERAADHGTRPGEERWYLAGWTIVVTNVPHTLVSLPEAVVLLRLRWQIERLVRLWKEPGQIDEWRSKKPWRILCELSAKLAAMVIQQWLIHEGCWRDPWRSLVQAAAVVRREAHRIMIALHEGGLEQVLHSIVRGMASGCRLQRRRGHPSTVQLLLEGLDWHVCLTSCVWTSTHAPPPPAPGPHRR